MSKKEPQLYLVDIYSSIEKIENYIKDLSFENFEKDEMTQDAVVRNLEIIGEAANQTPKDFAKGHSQIPWGKMISMRNKVLHEYFGVDVV